MKFIAAFGLLVAFAQYVIVPSFDTTAIAAQMNSHHQAIEEASK